VHLDHDLNPCFQTKNPAGSRQPISVALARSPMPRIWLWLLLQSPHPGRQVAAVVRYADRAAGAAVGLVGEGRDCHGGQRGDDAVGAGGGQWVAPGSAGDCQTSRLCGSAMTCTAVVPLAEVWGQPYGISTGSHPLSGAWRGAAPGSLPVPRGLACLYPYVHPIG